NSVLFVTFDDGTSTLGGGGHIPLVVVSSATPAGTQVTSAITPYNLLRTIEDAWSLAALGQSATATALTQFFPQPPISSSEQVIYASDVGVLSGLWTKVADPTAAGGIKLSTRDNGAATLEAPL